MIFPPKFYSSKGTFIEFRKFNIVPTFSNPFRCFNLVMFVGPVDHLVWVSTRTRQKHHMCKSHCNAQWKYNEKHLQWWDGNAYKRHGSSNSTLYLFVEMLREKYTKRDLKALGFSLGNVISSGVFLERSFTFWGFVYVINEPTLGDVVKMR